MKRTTWIVVNGRKYDGVEQMPPEVRAEYLKAIRALGGMDSDGVPEVLDNPDGPHLVAKESIIYNGKEYKSRDELPPEVRELLDHPPQPQPEEEETNIEVKTTRVLPSRVNVSERWVEPEQKTVATTSGSAKLLIRLLLAAALLLLFFWISGVKPPVWLRR